MSEKLNIEVFCAPHCSRCEKTWQMLEKIVSKITTTPIELQHRDVLQYLETAAKLGVRQTPTIVINGKIEFTGEPTESALKKKLLTLIEK